ncbi:DUF2157 domain-containing protein [Nocardiopsis composta]|uniref:DUF2157 domain-containing protein n=1 Tax=Nocardiopsis composta TaxID=157465 RepID=A0A7W8QL78_9ACTN|nr:DUF2157 domain-containing protein [Nocardiopsis composta]MBB5431805.1 hypothetical protein [Nocardiopsis composta]
MAEESRGARDEALGRLVAEGVITRDQAAAVGAALEAAEARPGVRWAEAVGYVGGALVLAAVAVFMATAWDAITPVGRSLLLAALVPVLAVAGAVMAGGIRALRPGTEVPTVRRRIGGTLFALAAVAASLAVGVWLDDLVDSYDDLTPQIAASAVGLVAAAGGYTALRSAPGLVAAWGMSAFLVGSAAWETAYRLTGAIEDYEAPGYAFAQDVMVNATGLSLAALGALWAGLAFAGVVRERGTAVGLGAATAFTGAEFLTEPFNHLGVLLLAAALFSGHVLWRSRPGAGRGPGAALVFGIIAVTVGIPQLVWYLTDGEMSAAGVLLVAGAVLLLSSWLGLRLHKAAGGPGTPGAGAPAPQGPPPGPAPEADAPPRTAEPAPPQPSPAPRQEESPPLVDPRDPDNRL